MILVAVSSHAWAFQQQAAISLINKLIQNNNQSNTIVLDRQTVNREAESLNSQTIEWVGHEIPFSSWLKDGMTEDGVLDVPAIRQSALQFSSKEIIVLNSSGHRDELVTAALAQARYGWFSLDKWQRAFVLVCDDIYLLHIADKLAFTFYCQPEILTEREAKRIAKTVHRRGFTYRWLGPGAGKFEAKVFKRLSAILNWWDARVERNEYKKQ